MLQRLIDLVFVFREYVVLAACVAVSLLLLTMNDNPQVKRLRTIATVVAGTVGHQLGFITAYFGLKDENAVLRRVNVELADEATQLREARLENFRLRSLLKFKEASAYRLIAAEVVGKSLALQRNSLTLNVGESDGVRPLMPVVSDAGLVGVVTAVSSGFSTVNIVLNTEFRASARVQRTRVDGIAAWDGTVLRFRNVAKTMDVQPGDVLLTSTYSNLFPPDIRIGVVKSVEQQRGSLFHDIIVAAGVDFVRLEEVFVVSSVPSAERAGLEQRSTR